jgi:hypothetical protein
MNYKQIDELMREIQSISNDIQNGAIHDDPPLSTLAFRLGQVHTRLAIVHDTLYKAKLEAGKDHAREMARDMASTAAAQQNYDPRSIAGYKEQIKRGSLADQIKAAKEPPQWDKTTYAFNPAVERQWTPDTPNLLYAFDTTGLAPGDSEEDWSHTPAGKEWLKANGV